MVVYKYPIELTDNPVIEIPAHGQIIHFGLQNDMPFVWVLCDPYRPLKSRRLHLTGTGNPLTVEPGYKLSHIGTVQTRHGYVWHLFEEKYITNL